jgi:hypothetical protein
VSAGGEHKFIMGVDLEGRDLVVRLCRNRRGYRHNRATNRNSLRGIRAQSPRERKFLPGVNWRPNLSSSGWCESRADAGRVIASSVPALGPAERPLKSPRCDHHVARGVFAFEPIGERMQSWTYLGF